MSLELERAGFKAKPLAGVRVGLARVGPDEGRDSVDPRPEEGAVGHQGHGGPVGGIGDNTAGRAAAEDAAGIVPEKLRAVLFRRRVVHLAFIAVHRAFGNRPEEKSGVARRRVLFKLETDRPVRKERFRLEVPRTAGQADFPVGGFGVYVAGGVPAGKGILAEKRGFLLLIAAKPDFNLPGGHQEGQPLFANESFRNSFGIAVDRHGGETRRAEPDRFRFRAWHQRNFDQARDGLSLFPGRNAQKEFSFKRFAALVAEFERPGENRGKEGSYADRNFGFNRHHAPGDRDFRVGNTERAAVNKRFGFPAEKGFPVEEENPSFAEFRV